MWCIAPESDAAFVAQMEQVLEVYKRPYEARRPLVCMDEQPRQLTREAHRTIPMTAGCPERIDYEYVREGLCQVWMFVEPLGGWRDVRVTEHRNARDWARQLKAPIGRSSLCGRREDHAGLR